MSGTIQQTYSRAVAFTTSGSQVPFTGLPGGVAHGLFITSNMAGLQVIVKMERDPKAKFTPEQAKMKAEWDKWREDTNVHQKAVTAARNAVTAATGPAEASLTIPGQPGFAADKFKGELVSKDVTLNAQVKAPDGQTTEKKLVVTIQRVVGTQDNAQREGRPIIVRIVEA